MRKKLYGFWKIWKICIIGTIIYIFIPICMDKLILGNGFMSNIDNSTWAGFFGGYFGGGFSLLGIAWTINDTRKQNKEDRILTSAPYLYIYKQLSITEKEKTKYTTLFNCTKNLNIVQNSFHVVLDMKICNYGFGNAYNINISEITYTYDDKSWEQEKFKDLEIDILPSKSNEYLEFWFYVTPFNNKDYVNTILDVKTGIFKFSIFYQDAIETEYRNDIEVKIKAKESDDKATYPNEVKVYTELSKQVPHQRIKN